jgi:hypothetical protein
MRIGTGRALLGIGLLVAAAGPAWGAEPEPNDDRASAPSISGGIDLADFAPSGVVTVDGTLGDGDVDHFAFGVRAGEPVSLALFEDADGQLHDPLLVVFDSAGTEIASNDDGGPGFFARLALVPAADDEWTVAVTRAPDVARDGDFGTPFDYRLVAAVAGPAALPDADATPGPQGANDTDATAQPLGGSTAVVSAALVPGDRDVFSFPVAAGELVTVSVFEPASGELHDSVLILRRAGSPLESDDDAGPGLLSNASRRVAAGEAGTWQVEVTGFASPAYAPHQQDFAYQLVVAAVTGVAPILCDANGDRAVDRRDVDAIFAARGTPATGPDDPRDADGDGTITVLDSRRCTQRCDAPDCAPASSCGLGAELLVVLAAAGAWKRRRQ